MFVFKLGFWELCVLLGAWNLYTFIVVCGNALTTEWDRVRRETVKYSPPPMPTRRPPSPPRNHAGKGPQT